MFKSLENGYAFAALPLRLGLGALFLVMGIFSLMDTAGTTAQMSAIGFPAPMVFAIIVMISQLVCGAFIILGLLTRLSAIWMTIVLLAVGIMAYAVNYQSGMLMDIMSQLVLIGATLCLMLSGPGRWSLDEKYFWE